MAAVYDDLPRDFVFLDAVVDVAIVAFAAFPLFPVLFDDFEYNFDRASVFVAKLDLGKLNVLSK